MPRFFNLARRADSILSRLPKLRGKIDSVCVEYHQIQENCNYDIDANGERWLLQTLAGKNWLKTIFDVGANHGDWAAEVLRSFGELEQSPDALMLTPMLLQVIARKR